MFLPLTIDAFTTEFDHLSTNFISIDNKSFMVFVLPPAQIILFVYNATTSDHFIIIPDTSNKY